MERGVAPGIVLLALYPGRAAKAALDIATGLVQLLQIGSMHQEHNGGVDWQGTLEEFFLGFNRALHLQLSGHIHRVAVFS